MLTKEVLINSLRPYCGVIMEYDRRNGRICVHWGGELAASVRQRWLLPEELRDAIRSSGITSQETAVWSRYLNAAYLRKFFERGAESESFRMEFQGNDRRIRQYDIRVEKLDGDSLLISGRVAREDGVDALTGVYSRSYYETHLKTGEARGGVAIIDLDDLKLCNDTYGHDGGDEMLTAAARVMQDAASTDGMVVRYGGDEFLLLLPEAEEEQFPAVLEEIRVRTAALRMREQPGLRLTASIGGVMARDETVADAVLRADRLMYRAKQRKDCVILEGQTPDDSAPEEQAPLLLVVDDAPLNRELLMAMLGDGYRYLEASDGAACLELLEQYGTGIELVLLDRLTEVSSAYRLTQAQCVTISAAAALHDVGKIGVDQSILNKPGRLTPEEFEAVKLHTVIGEELLRGMREYRGEELLETAAEICRWHHERYDGGGYPDGLKGDDIPIAAQVVSLADVYDALVSRRVYKEAYTPERAMEMIREGQCGVFNPLLVQCLTDIQDALRTEVYAGGPAS